MKQAAQAGQVVSGGREREAPADTSAATVLGLSQPARPLDPTKHLLDPLALVLADAIAGMAGRPPVYGRAPQLAGLGPVPIRRDMRRDPAAAQFGDERGGVITLV